MVTRSSRYPAEPRVTMSLLGVTVLDSICTPLTQVIFLGEILLSERVPSAVNDSRQCWRLTVLGTLPFCPRVVSCCPNLIESFEVSASRPIISSMICCFVWCFYWGISLTKI